MIVRSLALRHGRKALAKPPVRSWKRCLASTVESSSSPYDKSFQDQQYVEGGVDGSKSEAVRSLQSRKRPAGTGTDKVAQDYHDFQRHKELTSKIGSDVAPYYQPHTLLTNPPSPADITLELLLASQSHLGHATSLWNPANSRYIFGIREGIHIISLDVTAAHLRRACAVVKNVTYRGGVVLFVGTRTGQNRAVVKAAEMAGGCHLFDRWIPGSITNGEQILGNCPVKVVDQFDRDIRASEEEVAKLGALKPDLVVCLNPLENYIMLHECGLNNIPTIGVIDTDANPTWVTYPIPANDDSLRCIQVIAGTLGRAGEEGQAMRREAARKGIITYKASLNLVAPSTNDNISQEVAAQNAAESTDPDANNVVLSSQPFGGPTAADEAMDIELLQAYTKLDVADFDENDPAWNTLEDLIEGERPQQTESAEASELRDRIRETRMAAGLDPDQNNVVSTEELSPQSAAQLEDMAKSYMSEPLTAEEAAAIWEKQGGRGINDYIDDTVGEAVARQKQAEDPMLSIMIARKRKEMGEELTDEDKKILIQLGELRAERPKQGQNRVMSAPQHSQNRTAEAVVAAGPEKEEEALSTPEEMAYVAPKSGVEDVKDVAAAAAFVAEEMSPLTEQGRAEQAETDNAQTAAEISEQERTPSTPQGREDASVDADATEVAAVSSNIEESRTPLTTEGRELESENDNVQGATQVSARVEEEKTPLTPQGREVQSEKENVQGTARVAERVEEEKTPLTPEGREVASEKDNVEGTADVAKHVEEERAPLTPEGRQDTSSKDKKSD